MHLVQQLHASHESHLSQLRGRAGQASATKKESLNPMTRRLISSGYPLEKTAGYSRAVVEGEWVFVAGTTGFDYAAMTISKDLAEQVHQTFRNIAAALEQAGATLADVVRANYRSEERRVGKGGSVRR